LPPADRRTVSAELAAFVARPADLAAGRHLFDPGIGQLIKLWGFQADEFKAECPPEADIKAWLASKPSIADLTIDGNTISSRNRRRPRLRRLPERRRPRPRRRHPAQEPGHPQRADQHRRQRHGAGQQGRPRSRGGSASSTRASPGPLATVELDDGEAIGTSGDYQRFFEVDGKRYAHLLDPRTGYPADHTQAVTVLIPPGPKAGTLSDAASKPIFIAGPDGWREMAEKWKSAWFCASTATAGFSSPKPCSSA
jgi:thiamine biosynthesis lipoprotein